MATKNCDQCGVTFEGHGRAKRCSDACKKAWRKAAQAAYKKTDKAKAAQAAYRKSDAGKAYQAAYQKSDAGKAACAAYRKSDAGKAYQAAYRKSDAGKAAFRKAGHKRRATLAGAVSDGIAYPLEGQCVVCRSTENLAEEHMIAIANGGSDTLANKTTMCKSCNSSKGARIDYRDPGYTVWLVKRRLGI